MIIEPFHYIFLQVSTLEKDLNLSQMTEAQFKTIPILLARKDALVKSQTGSGKTLAYAIPIVEVSLLFIQKFIWYLNIEFEFTRHCNR